MLEALSFEEEQSLTDDEDPSLPEADWEKLIKLEKAEMFLDDTAEIIKFIHEKAGLKEPAIGILGTDTYWS